MNLFFSTILKWPKLVILLLIAATFFFANGILKLEFDNSTEAFLPTENDVYQYYTKSKEIYGDNNKFIIMAVSHPNLFSHEAFQLMDDLLKGMEEYEHYDAAREEERLKKLNRLLSTDTITQGALMTAFRNDPGFQRQIRRTMKQGIDPHAALSASQIKNLRKRAAASQQLKAQELVDFIISPLTMRDISGANNTLETYALMEKDDDGNRILPRTEDDFIEFRRKLTRNPAFKEGIYAVDHDTGRITDFGMIVRFVNITDQDPIAREIAAIANDFQGLTIVPMGIPIGVIQFTDYMRRDLFTFLPITLMVVAVVFFFNFRSFRGVVLPFSTVTMAMTWIMGLMGYLGFKITPVGISLPALMCAVGSSYAIHILNQYYANFDMITRQGLKRGLRNTMSHISITVLLAALTTFVAFMTLAPTGIIAISNWGILSAIGVFFAFFISITLIPASLAVMKHTRPKLLLKRNNSMKKTVVDRIIAMMTQLSVKHYKAVLAVVSILTIISGAGLSRVQVESDFDSYFKENDPLRVNGDIIAEKFVGDSGFNILINSGEENGIKTSAFLTEVEDIRNWLTSDDNPHLNIGRTDTFNDFIKTMHFAMNGDNPDYYKIPESDMDILDYLEIYDGEDTDSDGRPDDLASYIDPAYRTLNIVTRVKEKEGKESFGTARVDNLITQIKAHLDQDLPKEYTYTITGFLVINVIMSKYIVQGQLQSLMLSLIVIFIIVTLLFSNIKAGILSLIPMSVAVLFNFGIMGWLGINLDMVTSVIAAITIGIGVDDTIHFLNTFKYNRERGLSLNDTIENTLAVSGKAIIYTSLALIFGFITLTISNFKPIILFGILMSLTMIATTIGALLVLPAIIKLTNVNLEKSDAWYWRYMDLGKVFGLERLEPTN